MQKVILETKDGIKIVGDYYDFSQNKRGALLLHMMPANRKSWWDFALKLEDSGFQVLAIDLRGHGESEGGPEGYKNFSDEEHQKSILDIEAGIEFFEALDILPQDIALIGASIGANLALKYASEKKDFKNIVLLSPGLNYKEIKPLEFVNNLLPHQRIFIATSQDDIMKNGQKNSEEAVQIFKAIPNYIGKKLIIYQSAGHGTNMFDNHLENEPDLCSEIINWLYF